MKNVILFMQDPNGDENTKLYKINISEVGLNGDETFKFRCLVDSSHRSSYN